MSLEDQYNKFTQLYAEANIDALELRSSDRRHVNNFASAASNSSGIALDVGCGPGHITDYLTNLGVDVIGYDFSATMIAYARAHYPTSSFAVADLSTLPHAQGAVGGILSRYSLIHTDHTTLPAIFEHWAQVLESNAPVSVALFAADVPDRHGEPFDHKVATAYQLCPETISQQLGTAGFVNIDVSRRPHDEYERAINHAVLTARSGRSH